jgi:nucleotide-binding universal stress UspA family protein
LSYANILLANEASVDAHGALTPAIALARAFKAKLTMLVVTRRILIPTLMAEVDQACAAAKTRADFLGSIAYRQALEAGVTFELSLETGAFAERTLAYIRNHPVDLLVLGLARKRKLPSLLDTMEILFRQSNCSIHIIRENG